MGTALWSEGTYCQYTGASVLGQGLQIGIYSAVVRLTKVANHVDNEREHDQEVQRVIACWIREAFVENFGSFKFGSQHHLHHFLIHVLQHNVLQHQRPK